MKYDREGVILVVKTKDGFLVGVESGKGHASGLLRFPSGKLKPGETPMQSVLREGKEEVGKTFVPHNPKLVGEIYWETKNYNKSGKPISIKGYVVLCEGYSGKVGISTDGEMNSFEFLDLNQLKNMEMYEFHADILKRIEKGEYFHAAYRENEDYKLKAISIVQPARASTLETSGTQVGSAAATSGK